MAAGMKRNVVIWLELLCDGLDFVLGPIRQKHGLAALSARLDYRWGTGVWVTDATDERPLAR